MNAVFKDFKLIERQKETNDYDGSKGGNEVYTGSAGGAIFNANGSVEIVDSLFSGNLATFGGALAMHGGYISVDATAFDNNAVYKSIYSGYLLGKIYERGQTVLSDGGGAVIFSRHTYDSVSDTINLARTDIFSNKTGTGVATTITHHNSVEARHGRDGSDGPISLIHGNVYLDPAIVITENAVQGLNGVNRIAPHVSAALAPSPSQSNETQTRALGESALLTLAKGLNLSLDNPDLALVANSIISQSDGQIAVQLAGNRLVLTGTGLSFTGDPIALTAAEQILAAAGTITSITIQSKDGSTTIGTLTGISSSFKDVVTELTTTGTDTSSNALADVFGATITQNGSAEVDTLVGSKNADVINALESDDTVTGNAGDDMIDGGAGTDTSKYEGEAKHFSVTITKGTATTVLDRTGREGKDSLTSIEKLDFTGDKDVNLGVLDGVVNVSSADLSAFIEMYIAYFNRAPDAEGLFYWGTRLSAGMSKNEIAESFYVQPETQALYTNPGDTKGFVTAVYSNFLGRAPDTDGFNYWVKQLDDGIVSKPIFLLAIINGAKAASGSQTDVDYFTNKANIGAYYSVIKGMSDTDNGKAAMALYDGTAASVTAAKNAIDGYYAAAVDATSGELLINLVGVMDDPFAV